LKKYNLYIDGKWVDSSSGKSYDVLNPATEDVVAGVAEGTVEVLRMQLMLQETLLIKEDGRK